MRYHFKLKLENGYDSRLHEISRDNDMAWDIARDTWSSDNTSRAAMFAFAVVGLGIPFEYWRTER